MAAVAIKEEAPDTYSPKSPPTKEEGVDASGSGGGIGAKDNINKGKTKNTAPKATNDVDRKRGDLKKIKYNGPLIPAPKSKKPKNGLLKDIIDDNVNKKQGTKGLLGSNNYDSSRCGEIFVTNNAKKWTFVCTFCQKSTRDIGEFVCHIKFKHMNSPYYDEDDDADDEQQRMENSGVDESFNHGQDYIDCTNYLDVNVHTEDSDELPYKPQTPSLFKPMAPNKKPKIETSKKKDNEIVTLVDDEDDEDDDIDDDDDDDDMDADEDREDYKNYFDYDFDGQEDEEGGVQIIDDLDDETDRMNDDDGSSNNFSRRRSRTEGAGDSNNTIMDYDIDGDTKRYRSHVKGTAYCELCDKTFQYYSLYRNHMIKHSNVTPFKCQFCPKGFKSKQAIRYHMKTHAKEKPYSCPVCSSTYATANLFMSHVMGHEGDNCFPCMVCTKIFPTDQEREVHLESHSQERPYSCEFCSKRFRQKHHLSNHLKLHCQYRCDFCKNSFNSTQTQRRPYACPKCEAKPEIRKQVERQRSLNIKNSENQQQAPLMKFENVILQSTARVAPDTRDSPEAEGTVEVPSEGEEESEESNNVLETKARKKFPQCKYCRTTFNHVGALNFHLRQKHPQHFT